jgi:hypothetical protein
VAAKVDEFLHVLHATDVGLGMPAAELVRATGMTGARVGDWIVLFAPGRGGLASTSYSLPASSSKHLLTGMVPGAVYDILVDGVFVATVDASIRGTLRFDSQGAGSVEIRLSAPAVAANP